MFFRFSVLFCAGLLCAMPAFSQSSEIQQGIKLTALDGEAYGDFGFSVSLSGNRALVGAGGSNDHTGAAYIYEFNGIEWQEMARLTASDGKVGDQFGWSVSLSGNHALVGFPGSDGDTGAAYIFEYDGTSWKETAKLTPENGHGFFGWSVSISGNRALIGDWIDNFGRGAAYIFEYNGTTWEQVNKLIASDGFFDDAFGYSVSISGNQAIMGARQGRSAYLFEHNGNSWEEIAILKPSDDRAFFGQSVSLTEDRALIGAGNSAFVFESDGFTWKETSILTASNGEPFDDFGDTVSLAGNLALVGAPLDDERVGSAYLFEFKDNHWDEIAQLTATSRGQGDDFGQSVSISAERALIGANLDNDKGLDAGAAYLFDFGTTAPTTMHIAAITPAINIEGLNKNNSFKASFVIEDNRGNPVEGARVVGLFSGDLSGTDTGETNEAGTAVLEINIDSFTQLNVDICALVVTHPTLTYNPTFNASPNFACDASFAGVAVTALTLVDADSNQDLFELTDGATLDLSLLPKNLSVRADVTTGVKNVLLSVEPMGISRLEHMPPYALFGDTYLDGYLGGTLENGQLTLSATPYLEGGNDGEAGPSLAVTIDVVNGNSASIAVESFTLIDADTDQDLFPLIDGATLDLATLPPNLSVRANVTEGVKSVLLSMDSQGISRVEQIAPYTLFGDSQSGDYYGSPLSSGQHTLSATPYSESNRDGEEGTSLSIGLTIINQNTASSAATASTPGKQRASLAFAVDVPTEFKLEGNYPNPFNPQTTIRFAVPETAPVNVTVYDALGRVVATLVDGVLDAGYHEFSFEASNLPSGTYLYRMDSPAGSMVKTMVLVK